METVADRRPSVHSIVAGWEPRRDESGREYWFNLATNNTQWSRPNPGGATAHGVVDGWEQVRRRLRCLCRCLRCLYRCLRCLCRCPRCLRRCLRCARCLPLISIVHRPPPTPQRWTADGSEYWFSITLGTTQWHRPEPPAEGDPAAASTVVNADADATAAAAAVGAAAPAVGAAAPAASGGVEGWEQHHAPDGRAYWYHLVTGTTQWERPIVAPIAATAAPAPASSPAAAAEETASAAPVAATGAVAPAAASEPPAAGALAVKSEDAAATPAAEHIAAAENEALGAESDVDLTPQGGGCCAVA